MKRYYKNGSSGLSSVLSIPRTNTDFEVETAATKRESREFPSLPSTSIEIDHDEYCDISSASLDSVCIKDLSRLESNSLVKKGDRLKYKTVWMGPGGGYSLMEEYVEPRKCMEREVPKESEMELKRYRQPGSCKNSKSMTNLASNSSVQVMEEASILKEDSYIFKSSRSLANVDWNKQEFVGPLPFQNKVAIGNRSCLGRNLIPL
ncbi:unnamed protein product [Cryptosporidium hominis]|uniref:Uncharacterized protein n=1 Tax=Cryptosporidium hominis TaxID=237895 RepID=A0A0S4TEH5_CRYHO|nr:hypothetical protein [Cryptosporidium hominis TU502]OLQ16043.1 hypothetical protein ChTU502y2012_313g0080 [Cryptosporidium hominis]PPA63305.1 hypothetical protein ChUKH1_09570 [Cryptosporidium hominis]PPS93710.1 Uncharacterized protein GY17_00002574 [Cryptosporidium hominis]CUV05287.1 unnamed protein product [Cryptosporidium hominis]|eukprot:PPS93710.1 Uncharacterized protein GY17_00002574 [Cryptosporidium hominis]